MDRACSFSKIDRQIKDNAYHALQEAERQQEKIPEGSGIGNTIDSILVELNIFSLLDSPHYDATLADYIKALKARKLAAKNRIRIRRRL